MQSQKPSTGNLVKKAETMFQTFELLRLLDFSNAFIIAVTDFSDAAKTSSIFYDELGAFLLEIRIDFYKIGKNYGRYAKDFWKSRKEISFFHLRYTV